MARPSGLSTVLARFEVVTRTRAVYSNFCPNPVHRARPPDRGPRHAIESFAHPAPPIGPDDQRAELSTRSRALLSPSLVGLEILVAFAVTVV